MNSSALERGRSLYLQQLLASRTGSQGGFVKNREDGVLPPSARHLLEKVGNNPITSITLFRAPIPFSSLLHYIKQYNIALQDLHYDEMFHLGMILNNQFVLEKTQVVAFYSLNQLPQGERMEVRIPNNFDTTIKEFIEKTKKYMGAADFTNYDVASNNCQVFTQSALNANGLLTPENEKFVVQDVEAVLKRFPAYYKKIIDFFTDLAAKVDVLVEGEGAKTKYKRIIVKKYKPLIMRR